MFVLVKDDTQLLKVVKVAAKNEIKLKGEVLKCQKNVFCKETRIDRRLEFTIHKLCSICLLLPL